MVVTAVGKARFVRGEWLKPGVVVVEAGHDVGDVEFDGAVPRASLLAAVPGGVGP